MKDSGFDLIPKLVTMVQLARRDGFTPLHEAAAAGHTECAKVLLSIGATPDVTNSVSIPQLAHAF